MKKLVRLPILSVILMGSVAWAQGNTEQELVVDDQHSADVITVLNNEQIEALEQDLKSGDELQVVSAEDFDQEVVEFLKQNDLDPEAVKQDMEDGNGKLVVAWGYGYRGYGYRPYRRRFYRPYRPYYRPRVRFFYGYPRYVYRPFRSGYIPRGFVQPGYYVGNFYRGIPYCPPHRVYHAHW